MRASVACAVAWAVLGIGGTAWAQGTADTDAAPPAGAGGTSDTAPAEEVEELDSTPKAESEAKSPPEVDATAAVPAPAAASDTAPVESPPPDAVEPAPPTADRWHFGVDGYVRAGYEAVQKDPNYDFIGQNNGFVLDNARIGIRGKYGSGLSFRVSAEGASDVLQGVNTPSGSLDVRLRDGFLRYDFLPQVGLQVGQFKAPFALEEMGSTEDDLFASEAVGQEGVLPGRGFQQDGLAMARQLGAMVSPREPIMFGDFGVAYYLMVMNGNGQNELLDDNGKVGFIGRVELLYSSYVQLGGAVLKNDRRIGALPNQFDEEDVGFAVDLAVNAVGLELNAQLVSITTSFPTVGADDQAKLAYHAEAGYRIKTPYVWITPAYRYAYYHPWFGAEQGEGGIDLESFELVYHTLGLRLEHAKAPVAAFANYTLTQEPEARQLENNRFQLLFQVRFE